MGGAWMGSRDGQAFITVKKARIARAGIQLYTADEIRARGIVPATSKQIYQIDPRTCCFNGYTYHLHNTGYYVRRYEQHGVCHAAALHRDVWIYYNGPIPDGFHIHHINEIKTDNRIENLDIIQKGMHHRLHNTGKNTAYMKYSAGERVCPVCGISFRTKRLDKVHCTKKCSQKARRDRRKDKHKAYVRVYEAKIKADPVLLAKRRERDRLRSLKYREALHVRESVR
jgi:hypothetical protein